jgi:hypothetical protein
MARRGNVPSFTLRIQEYRVRAAGNLRTSVNRGLDDPLGWKPKTGRNINAFVTVMCDPVKWQLAVVDHKMKLYPTKGLPSCHDKDRLRCAYKLSCALRGRRAAWRYFSSDCEKRAEKESELISGETCVTPEVQESLRALRKARACKRVDRLTSSWGERVHKLSIMPLRASLMLRISHND